MCTTTKYTDHESGLVYYGYRFYNPLLGRWISRDPAAERQGLNLYAFLFNLGINAIDRSGLDVYGEDYTKEVLLLIKQGLKNVSFAEKVKLMFEWFMPQGVFDVVSFLPNDTFMVGGSELTAAQFGNYLAGYAAAYGFGMVGSASVHIAGGVDGALDSIFTWQFKPSQLLFLGDDWGSFKMILSGRFDGFMDSLFDDKDDFEWDIGPIKIMHDDGE